MPAGVRGRARRAARARSVGLPRGGIVEYRDLAGLDGAALDALIARQVRVFAARGESFEWKLHGHDRPADLPDRLRAAGFAPQEPETLLAAHAATIAARAGASAGGARCEPSPAWRISIASRPWRRAIWGADHSWLAEMLARRAGVRPRVAARSYVAEVAGEVVSAAWVRFAAGIVRDAPRRRHAARVARPRDLPRARRRARPPRAEHGYPQLAVDTSEDEPADPRAPRLRGDHHDDAIHLVTRTIRPMTVHEQVELIETREDLVAFIEQLRSEHEEHPEGWGNSDLPSFLDGLAGWTDDMAGYLENQGLDSDELPVWRLFGMMLLAAAAYE